MNKEQLEAIKERVVKATPGEWIGDYGGVETTHKDFQKVSGGVYGEHNTICNTFDGEYIENSNAIHDSRFIAHARQDVPALIAEVERLREFEVFVKMYYTQFLKERSENESRRLTANTQLGFYVKANDLLGEPNGLPLKEGDSDE